MAYISGTLDLLVLKTLTWGPRHGYAIARWLEDTTDEDVEVMVVTYPVDFLPS